MLKLVLFVLTVSVGLPPVSVLVSENTALPEQAALSYRLNATVPPAARLPLVALISAVSFGIQLCFVLISVGICRTITSSLESVHCVLWLVPLVFGGSPL